MNWNLVRLLLLIAAYEAGGVRRTLYVKHMSFTYTHFKQLTIRHLTFIVVTSTQQGMPAAQLKDVS